MKKKTKHVKGSILNRHWFAIFVFPVLFALTCVVIVPFIMGLYYSMTDWDGVAIGQWIGLANYEKLFHDENFISALWFTFKFSFVTIILINAIGLGLALLVDGKFHGSSLLRTIFFMPNLVGGLILGFIWQFIFTNAFTMISNRFDIPVLSGWLSTPTTGFWAIVIVTCWQMGGYVMVIYLAYLQNVDQTLIESSALDGANSLQQFLYIKMPLIMPGFTVSLFMTLSSCFKLYDQNLSLTNGGPHNSTQMLAMNIFNTAFKENKNGYAQAKAVVFFVIVGIISLTQVYFTKRKEVEV